MHLNTPIEVRSCEFGLSL